MACPDPEDLAQLASPAGDSENRGAIADHAASCESCHAALVLLLADGTQASVETPRERPAGTAAGEPRRIDRYEIRRRLGAGGMGVVYLARDPELGRDVAIKVLRRGAHAERLRREAQALARLSHPNVVTVHDVGEHDGQLFVAMALVDGVNLREWLATPRETPSVLRVLVLAARGVIAAHGAGLIHRDLKPDNIFVATDGTVQVGDFGLVRDSDDAEPPAAAVEAAVEDLTMTGSVLGTPAYMAPEQTRGQADERSDQFSFCVTAYEALCGARPFCGTTIDALTGAIARGEVAELPRDRGIPGRVERALRRGLRARPDDRFESMTALVRELEPPPRRWPFLAAGLAVAGAAVAVTAIATRTQPGPDPEETCAPTATMIDATWNGAKRSELAGALAAHGHTPDAVSELGRRLDRYAASWTEVRRATCLAEASHQLAPAQAAIRVACLETRRAQLAATTGSVAAATTGDVFATWKQLGSLAPPASCASDDVALLVPVTAGHTALMRELAAAPDSEAIVALDRRASTGGDPASRLEIAFAVAADALDDTRLGAADEALSRARQLAEQIGAPSARVRAFAMSARSLCIQGRADDAAKFLELAVAGASHTTEVDEIDEARLECMYRRGEHAALLPLLRQRVAMLQRRYGQEGLEEAAVHWRLAHVLFELDRAQESAAESAAALRIQRRFVPASKEAAVAESLASLRAIEAQDLDGAVAHSRRSVELFLALPDDPDLQIELLGLGGLYGLAADPKAAIATYSLALDRFPAIADQEQRSEYRAEALDGRGWMRLRLGDHAGALSDFQGALDLGTQLGRPAIRSSAQIGLGRAWIGLGEHARAARVLREALATYEGSRHGLAQFALAQALWETGDRKGAIALARTAETEIAAGLELTKQSALARRLVPGNEAMLASVTTWRDTHR